MRLPATYHPFCESDTLKPNDHAYSAVDVEIVWTIATRRLSELKAVLKVMLRDLSLQEGDERDK